MYIIVLCISVILLIIEYLLCYLNSKKGAHLLRDNQGYTPLMIAAKSGHVEPFEVLLHHSVNYHPEEIQTPESKKKKPKKKKQKKKVSGLVLFSTSMV